MIMFDNLIIDKKYFLPIMLASSFHFAVGFQTCRAEKQSSAIELTKASCKYAKDQ